MNNIMKKFIAKYMLIAGGLLTLGSCSDFAEINTNPDAATSVSSEMLATNLILNVSANSSFLNPALLSKAISHTEFPNSLQYNNLGKQGFDGLVILTNVEKMINLAPEGGRRTLLPDLASLFAPGNFMT
jgi:hypothetical protein